MGLCTFPLHLSLMHAAISEKPEFGYEHGQRAERKDSWNCCF